MDYPTLHRVTTELHKLRRLRLPSRIKPITTSTAYNKMAQRALAAVVDNVSTLIASTERLLDTQIEDEGRTEIRHEYMRYVHILQNSEAAEIKNEMDAIKKLRDKMVAVDEKTVYKICQAVGELGIKGTGGMEGVITVECSGSRYKKVLEYLNRV